MYVLEHVYNPQKACENLYRLRKDGGYLLVFAPFLHAYHSHPKLVYQDYYRFTRDGLCFLFKEFSEVTIYPYRRKYFALYSKLNSWRARVERIVGRKPARMLFGLCGLVPSHTAGEDEDVHLATGYHVWARK